LHHVRKNNRGRKSEIKPNLKLLSIVLFDVITAEKGKKRSIGGLLACSEHIVFFYTKKTLPECRVAFVPCF